MFANVGQRLVNFVRFFAKCPLSNLGAAKTTTYLHLEIGGDLAQTTPDSAEAAQNGRKHADVCQTDRDFVESTHNSAKNHLVLGRKHTEVSRGRPDAHTPTLVETPFCGPKRLQCWIVFVFDFVAISWEKSCRT